MTRVEKRTPPEQIIFDKGKAPTTMESGSSIAASTIDPLGLGISRGKKLTTNYLTSVLNGSKLVQLQASDVDMETGRWKKVLILYVVGASPMIGSFERFIAKQWNFAAKPKLYYHNEGYFVVLFNSLEDREAVLLPGPYMLNNKPIILKVWSEKFDFSAEVSTTLPIWVKFSNLLLNCWSQGALSRISSAIGNHLFDDDCTTRVERISYAGVLIEMNVTWVINGTLHRRRLLLNLGSLNLCKHGPNPEAPPEMQVDIGPSEAFCNAPDLKHELKGHKVHECSITDKDITSEWVLNLMGLAEFRTVSELTVSDSTKFCRTI
ncbi:hypothetical protein BC332_00758 [Capsicum chinense]|nr:hypothetical protein BC332_00758 [Capsicum chinense]